MSEISPSTNVTKYQGYGLEGKELDDVMRSLDQTINQAWLNEYYHSEGSLFGIRNYQRVTDQMGYVGLNVRARAFELSNSDDPEQSQLGDRVLFHLFVGSAISATKLIKEKFARFGSLDEEELFQEGLVAIQTYKDGSKNTHIEIHQRVSQIGKKILAQDLDIPTAWIDEDLLAHIASQIDYYSVDDSVDVISRNLKISPNDLKHFLTPYPKAFFNGDDLEITPYLRDEEVKEDDAAYEIDEHKVDLKSLNPFLLNLLSRLPIRDKEIFIAKYGLDNDCDEIAESDVAKKLNLMTKDVRSSLSRTRYFMYARLRQQFGI